MKAYVVVEGNTEVLILRAVLPPQLVNEVALVAAGGRSNLTSTARTLLVTRRKPMAVLVDTDSTDESVIRERWQSTHELLREVSGGVRFKVILLVPSVEIVFFQAPGGLKKEFGHEPSSETLLLARTNPKEALEQLLKGRKGPGTLSELLDALGDQEVEALRSTGPMRELIQFLTEVVGELPGQSLV
jgi:hypothetical protein